MADNTGICQLKVFQTFQSFIKVLEEVVGAPNNVPLIAPVPPGIKDDNDTMPGEHALYGLKRMQQFMLAIGLPHDRGWEARAARYGVHHRASSGGTDGGGDSDSDSDSDSDIGSDDGSGSDAGAGQEAAAAGAASTRQRRASVQLKFRHPTLTRSHAVYGVEPAIRRACFHS